MSYTDTETKEQLIARIIATVQDGTDLPLWAPEGADVIGSAEKLAVTDWAGPCWADAALARGQLVQNVRRALQQGAKNDQCWDVLTTDDLRRILAFIENHPINRSEDN